MGVSSVNNFALKQYTVVNNSNNKNGNDIKGIIASLRQISKILDYSSDDFIGYSINGTKEIYYFPKADIVDINFSAKNNLDIVLDTVFCKRLYLNDEFLAVSTELLLKCIKNIDSVDAGYENEDGFEEMVLEAYQRFFDKLSPQEQDDFCNAFAGRSTVVYQFFMFRKRTAEMDLINRPFNSDPWGTGRFNP